MNDIERDAMVVWEHMSSRKFDVYSPGEISRYCFGDVRSYGNSNGATYRRAIRALNCLSLAGVVESTYFFGSNQSVYWLKEKTK